MVLDGLRRDELGDALVDAVEQPGLPRRQARQRGEPEELQPRLVQHAHGLDVVDVAGEVDVAVARLDLGREGLAHGGSVSDGVRAPDGAGLVLRA